MSVIYSERRGAPRAILYDRCMLSIQDDILSEGLRLKSRSESKDRMPKYLYQAKDTALKRIEGTIEAENQTAAIARLGSLGVYPLIIHEAEQAQSVQASTLHGRVPSRTLSYMSRQLADLLSGGLSLFHALSLLAEQTEHRLLRQVIVQISEAIRDGQALSDALSRHPDVFSPLYTSMIRAGEAGGGLDAVLVRLADLGEAESELKSRVASALVYPLVVLMIGIATILVLLTYVVPKLTSLFAETGQLLPLPTRILLGISHGLTQWWWLWVAIFIGAIWATRWFRLSAVGRGLIDRAILHVPVVGTLIRKIQVAQFTRNLGVMAGQGVPILQALEVSGATVANSSLRQAVLGIREAVQGGDSLSRAIAASRQFPAFVSNMAAVGEESGTLDAALLKIASGYERETDRLLRTLTTVLEPLLIVLVGLVVMFIVISMLLPIFQLGLVAQ